jgi:hypothetical protein
VACGDPAHHRKSVDQRRTGGWSACCPIAVTLNSTTPPLVCSRRRAPAGVDLERETRGLVGINATLLRDGRVLFTAEPAAQVYDPVAGTFSRAGTMITGTGVLGFRSISPARQRPCLTTGESCSPVGNTRTSGG